jgi:hypothetical protein
VIDLGESKVLGVKSADMLAVGRARYNAVDYRALEVSQNEGWTVQADVYSFGVLCRKVLTCRAVECTSAPPDWVINNVGSLTDDLKSNYSWPKAHRADYAFTSYQTMFR